MKKGNSTRTRRSKTEYIFLENGDGYKVTVEKSGNKSVRIPIEDRAFDGGRHRKKFTAPTTAELQAAVTAYLKGEEEKHGEGLTFLNACIEYVDLRAGLAESTLTQKRMLIRNRFKSLHSKPIMKLTKQDIYSAVTEEATVNHLAKSTLQTALVFMISVLTEYEAPVLTMKLKRDIMRYAASATAENKGRKDPENWENAPTAVEVAKWASENTRRTVTRTAISILLDLHSLRSEETRGLQYRDVIEQDGKCYLNICRTRTCMCSKDIYREATKTDGSRRKVLIDRRLYDMIHAQPHQSEDEFVIDVCRSVYALGIQRVMKDHGADWITPHDLRHIFKTSNLNNDIATGGWSIGGSVAEKVYTHITQKDKDSFMTEYSRSLLDAYCGTPDSESQQPEQETAPHITMTARAV